MVAGGRECVCWGVEWRDCMCWGGGGECVEGERVCVLGVEWRDCVCWGGVLRGRECVCVGGGGVERLRVLGGGGSECVGGRGGRQIPRPPSLSVVSNCGHQQPCTWLCPGVDCKADEGSN